MSEVTRHTPIAENTMKQDPRGMWVLGFDYDALELERQELHEALEEIVRVYNDDSLSNSAAQDRTDEIARAAQGAISETRPVNSGPSGGRENRLGEAEAIIAECDSPDGFCGEMPDELRNRLQVFLGKRAECSVCGQLQSVIADGRVGRHLASEGGECSGSLQNKEDH
jgi:hypothetical protein